MSNDEQDDDFAESFGSYIFRATEGRVTNGRDSA
jgi:hypothetical protein